MLRYNQNRPKFPDIKFWILFAFVFSIFVMLSLITVILSLSVGHIYDHFGLNVLDAVDNNPSYTSLKPTFETAIIVSKILMLVPIMLIVWWIYDSYKHEKENKEFLKSIEVKKDVD